MVLECVIVRERAFGNGLFGHALAFVPVVVTVPAQRVVGRGRPLPTTLCQRRRRFGFLASGATAEKTSIARFH